MKRYPAWLGIGTIVAIVIVATGVFCLWRRSQPKTIPQPTNVISSNYIYEIVAIGDLACSSNSAITPKTCQFPNVARAVAATQPDAVFLLGDLQYDKGESSNFTDSFDKAWSGLKPISYAVPGNHEYGTASAKGYFDYWNGQKDSSKQAGERGKGYYSFNLGNWHIIALNSNCEHVGGCDTASVQGKWLAEDLKTSEGKCTMAFWHHPHFTSGNYKDDNSTLVRGQAFWQLLHENGADIVLNGHDHLYERLAPQTETGQLDNNHGIRQFTVGTGGKSLYALREPIAAHEAGYDEAFGYLELKLESGKYSWKFIDINGIVHDAGKDQCKTST